MNRFLKNLRRRNQRRREKEAKSEMTIIKCADLEERNDTGV